MVYARGRAEGIVGCGARQCLAEKRVVMKPSKSPDQALPQRKISEAFLDFAAPVLATMPIDATDAAIEHALGTPFVVWNAVVIEAVTGDGQYLEQMRQLLSHHPAGIGLITMLVDRKRALFAEDQRLIGKYEVRRKDGQLNLWAEARTVPLPRQ